MKDVKLLDKIVGDEHPCYVVAEIGGAFTNFEEAKRLIDSGLEIGVDAIKFQTFKTSELVSDSNQKYTYKSHGKKITESMYDMFKRCELDKRDWKKILEEDRKENRKVFG